MGKDSEETGKRGIRQRHAIDNNDSEDATACPRGRGKRTFPVGSTSGLSDGPTTRLGYCSRAVDNGTVTKTEGEDSCTILIYMCHGRARQFHKIQTNSSMCFSTIRLQ
jgi:hypothetical protein